MGTEPHPDDVELANRLANESLGLKYSMSGQTPLVEWLMEYQHQPVYLLLNRAPGQSFALVTVRLPGALSSTGNPVEILVALPTQTQIKES